MNGPRMRDVAARPSSLFLQMPLRAQRQQHGLFVMRHFLTLLLLSCSLTSQALPDAAALQASTVAFTKDRADDAKLVLLGPSNAEAKPVSPELTCAELYARKLSLMHQQLDRHPEFLNDARNQTAFAVGTVTTWGFAFLPFSALQSYTEHARQRQVTTDLDALRYASARLQCYRR